MLRDPQLQRAARRELEGLESAAAAAAAAAGLDPSDPFNAAALCAGGAGHNGEVDRQRAAVRELDEQVSAESKVNRGMAVVLCDRLDSSRK